MIIRDIKTGLIYDVEYNKASDTYILKQGNTIVKSIYPVRFRALLYSSRYKEYEIIVDD